MTAHDYTCVIKCEGIRFTEIAHSTLRIMSGDREQPPPKPCYLSPTLTAHSQPQKNTFYRERTLTGTRIVSACLVGDRCCGKTALAVRLTSNTFNAHTPSTIGGSTHSVRHQDQMGEQCLINIRDTSGNETFRSVMPVFIRGVEFAVLVFDLTNRASFNSLAFWAGTVRRCQPQHLHTLLLCGTKLDVVIDDSSRRAVTEAEGRAMAAKLGCADFFETSAKTGSGTTAMKDLIVDMANKEEEEVHLHIPSDPRILKLRLPSAAGEGRCYC